MSSSNLNELQQILTAKETELITLRNENEVIIHNLKAAKVSAEEDFKFLQKERCQLYSKIKSLEDLLIKRDQTAQTIFLNKPKDVKFSKWTYEGLGFVNPHMSDKISARQLYDFDSMNLGLTKENGIRWTSRRTL